ncbi:MAG: aminodeoxychorismate/anthranilate synthase component II [Pseudomonadota bacterium]|nr:aminodeoxychorismate/anthranilate synthase component II [Pseudomonadota bacterium]
MLLLIDNYDSFTYNLVHFLGELGEKTLVYRNDKLDLEEAIEMNPDAIILSPGPCDPDKAGICIELVKHVLGKIPVLGVCLGHQVIGQALGGKIIRGPKPMHGKSSLINHQGTEIFKDIPSPFLATRYHSLIVEKKSLPNEIIINSFTKDKIIMGISHSKFPLYGVQFHPESIGTNYGHTLLANFLKIAKKWKNRE